MARVRQSSHLTGVICSVSTQPIEPETGKATNGRPMTSWSTSRVVWLLILLLTLSCLSQTTRAVSVVLQHQQEQHPPIEVKTLDHQQQQQQANKTGSLLVLDVAELDGLLAQQQRYELIEAIPYKESESTGREDQSFEETEIVENNNRDARAYANKRLKSRPRIKSSPTGGGGIIFVPGDGGSRLEARLNKSHRVHYICAQKSDWYDIWVNIHLWAPLVIDCFYDNFRLHYNPSTGLTENTPGVEIRPGGEGFGALEPVAYLNSVRMPKMDYFEAIISELESSRMLKRNVDMQGAAFDFRRAPNELGDWLANLTELIESNYAQAGYKPVTLICHSMGCLNMVHLLNQKSDTWKELYVARLVALGAPWSGSFKALSAMLFGDNLGIPFLDPVKLRVLQASWPSLMYLFPREPAFPSDQVLIESPDKNYTLANLDQLFEDAKLPDQRDIWHETRHLANEHLKAPNVELWCLYGTQLDTPNRLVLDESLADSFRKCRYREEMGDGDGTVNLESSGLCRDWGQQQQKPVYLRKFPGVDHNSILRDSRVVKYISETILSSS